MSKKRSKSDIVPQWLETTLQSFSPGELQYGADVTELRRDTTEKYHPIVTTGKKIKGTGIPAYVFSKFRSGEWIPREKSRRKITAFLKRYRFQQLRNVGARKDQATKLSKIKEYPEFNKTYNQYFNFAREVGQAKGVDPEYIMVNMRKSELRLQDFEDYINQLRAEKKTQTIFNKLTKKRKVKRKTKPEKRKSKKQIFQEYKNSIKNDLENISAKKQLEYTQNIKSEITEKLQSGKLNNYEKGLFRDVLKFIREYE